MDLSVVVTQDQFGELVGISHAAVSGLLSAGVLSARPPAGHAPSASRDGGG